VHLRHPVILHIYITHLHTYVYIYVSLHIYIIHLQVYMYVYMHISLPFPVARAHFLSLFVSLSLLFSRAHSVSFSSIGRALQTSTCVTSHV